MKIFKNKKTLINEISNRKNIAFVPTMGSLHKGHLSLIQNAKKKSKNVLVSIYINPKQFNSNSDFKKYPRNIDKDIAFLKKTKIKYLYLPTDKDIYSFTPKKIIYLDEFSKKLCGRFRPKHFIGVVDVINRFIEIIKPHLLFLGQKDFQQLELIKLHLNKNKILTKIISCPTIREINGIALSSRNLKLNKNQIKTAAKVYKYLRVIKKNVFSVNSKKQKFEMLKKILSFGVKKIDYLEYINTKTLKPTKKINKSFNIFIAYYVGNVRLIDNL